MAEYSSCVAIIVHACTCMTELRPLVALRSDYCLAHMNPTMLTLAATLCVCIGKTCMLEGVNNNHRLMRVCSAEEFVDK